MINACKHAEANLIKVEFKNDDDGLILNVVDDGIGFAEDESEFSEFGILGMRKGQIRFMQFLDFISQANGGSCVELRLSKDQIIEVSDERNKVLIVDDNAVLRMGLSLAVIEIEDGYTVVGEASNAEEALVLYKRHEPDVVTMDYQMPGADGVACTQKIMDYDPNAKVVLLTIKELEEDIWNAVQAGCKGYLTKRAGEIEDVLQAIKEVASGNTYFPAKITEE